MGRVVRPNLHIENSDDGMEWEGIIVLLMRQYRKISKIGASMQMSDFKAKMHQIRFLSSLRPYSALIDPQLYLRGLLTRGERRKG